VVETDPRNGDLFKGYRAGKKDFVVAQGRFWAVSSTRNSTRHSAAMTARKLAAFRKKLPA
jgi:formate-dependent nitrite reductase cytochrome c552 subunit